MCVLNMSWHTYIFNMPESCFESTLKIYTEGPENSTLLPYTLQCILLKFTFLLLNIAGYIRHKGTSLCRGTSERYS